ncbi:MAG: hypothetical protein QOI82_1089 [Actinomycetota bacterium]|jgi:hypothetical protein|nr:hypothetical protein [Actinomycetota bacterium]
MASGDDVQLPDLQVIQRYSLAVRSASAPVADVIQALQSDLAWLTGGARRRTVQPAKPSAPAKTTPARAVAKKSAAKKSPAKKAAAKKSGARRA